MWCKVKSLHAQQRRQAGDVIADVIISQSCGRQMDDIENRHTVVQF